MLSTKERKTQSVAQRLEAAFQRAKAAEVTRLGRPLTTLEELYLVYATAGAHLRS